MFKIIVQCFFLTSTAKRLKKSLYDNSSHYFFECQRVFTEKLICINQHAISFLKHKKAFNFGPTFWNSGFHTDFFKSFEKFF